MLATARSFHKQPGDSYGPASYAKDEGFVGHIDQDLRGPTMEINSILLCNHSLPFFGDSHRQSPSKHRISSQPDSPLSILIALRLLDLTRDQSL